MYWRNTFFKQLYNQFQGIILFFRKTIWGLNTTPNPLKETLSLPAVKNYFFKPLILPEKINTFVETLEYKNFYNSFSLSLTTKISAVLTYRIQLLKVWRKTIGNGFLQLQTSFVILYVDALITDDEPIWEPVEWSLIQSWILFTFLFGWIAENLISSRYGSYAGRDKRVWFAWYKNAWLVISYYAITIGAAVLFVVVPFYHEISSLLPFAVSWWDWYNRIFFTNFVTYITIILMIALFFQITIRTMNWKKSWVIILLVNLLLLGSLYGHFLMSFFSYLTDSSWYNKTRLIDYVQLSHEPNKWSWGSSKRDHFSYHKSTTVFWFKNDGPFAQATLVIHLFFFWSFFGVSFFWLTLIRRVYAIEEISFTYATYAVSCVKQFSYFFLLFLLLILISYLTNYWRLPLEFLWAVNNETWSKNFLLVIKDYHTFILPF